MYHLCSKSVLAPISRSPPQIWSKLGSLKLDTVLFKISTASGDVVRLYGSMRCEVTLQKTISMPHYVAYLNINLMGLDWIDELKLIHFPVGARHLLSNLRIRRISWENATIVCMLSKSLILLFLLSCWKQILQGFSSNLTFPGPLKMRQNLQWQMHIRRDAMLFYSRR